MLADRLLMAASATITFDDFVAVWRERQRFSTAHPDLATYHESRYRAHCAAFGVDLDFPPADRPPEPAWLAEGLDEFARQLSKSLDGFRHRWHIDLHQFSLIAEREIRHGHNPFSSYLLAPLSVRVVRRRFGPAIITALDAAISAVDAMILEILTAVFPEAVSRLVAPSDLKSHGFDPAAPAPDPDRYW